MSGPPLTARRAHTRDKLMDAALDVFAEKGVLGATVEEICERAGFTRGAFYSNFESKDDLCVAARARFVADAEEAMRAAVAVLPPEVNDPAAVTDVVDAALNIALDDSIATPSRVLARLEVDLHFLRNPGLASDDQPLSCPSPDLIGLMDAELRRVNYALRLPTAEVMDILGCILDVHTMRGEDPAAIRALMGETLKSLMIARV